MSRVQPHASPPLGVVAPFFLAAPFGLALAGWMLLTAGSDALLAVNAPHLVAAAHAALLGWLTMTIMGAVYQLGPAVLGGRLLSVRLARLQFVTHAASVLVFVVAAGRWDVRWMSVAGVGVVFSFLFFLVNAVPAVRWMRGGPTMRVYLSTSVALLAVTAGFGITWAGALEHLWFPVTLGRLGGHAHLGLLGWLALTIMGVAYQLVPMFLVVQHAKPRFARSAFLVTVAAAAIGAPVLMTDPGPGLRAAIAVAFAAGPALWAVDIALLFRSRSRRALDVQGRGVAVSLGFLACAIVLGLSFSAAGIVDTGIPQAHLQLAYGLAAITGWAGTMLVGTSYKILPFLVWFHRYRLLAGTRPVPLTRDIYSEPWANVALAALGAGTILGITGALFGELWVLQAAGLVLVTAAAAHGATLAHVLLGDHKRVSRQVVEVRHL